MLPEEIFNILFLLNINKKSKYKLYKESLHLNEINPWLVVISIVFICFGVVKVILGLTKKNKYTAVLKDIQNGTFVQ